MEAKLKLESEIQNGNLNKKRKRSEDEAMAGPSSDNKTNRDSYPVDTKPPYLQLKNSVKKVILAANVKTLEGNVSMNIFPKGVDFRIITNSTRDPSMKMDQHHPQLQEGPSKGHGIDRKCNQ